MRLDATRLKPACQPEAVTAGLEGQRNPRDRSLDRPPCAAQQRRGSRPQTSLGLPAPVGPSSHLRLRSGGRQNWCSWTCSSQSLYAQGKRLLMQGIDGFRSVLAPPIPGHGRNQDWNESAPLAAEGKCRSGGPSRERSFPHGGPRDAMGRATRKRQLRRWM